MSPLAGTQEWTSEVVRRRLSFLFQCVTQHRNLSTKLGRPRALADERISSIQRQTSLFQEYGLEAQLLVEAAEILLVLGDTSAGIKIVNEVVSRLLPHSETAINYEYPGTLQQFVMASVFSALTRRGSLRVTEEGTAISHDGRTAYFNWNSNKEMHELARTLPTLLSVLTFDDGADYVASFLTRSQHSRRFGLILAAAATQPEFVVLGLLPAIYRSERMRSNFSRLNRRDGLSALRGLELQYSMRIDLLRSDAFHWRTLRPRAELIDWPLLICQVALVRGGGMKFDIHRQDETLSPTEFSRSLATQFANRNIVRSYESEL